MPIAKQHILTHIPEAQLWALLVLDAFNLRVFDLLQIELCNLNRRSAHGEDSMDQPNGFQMRLDLVLYRRGKPALWFLSIEEPAHSVARFATSSGPAELPPGREQFLDIGTGLDFCFKENVLLGGSRNADMFSACVNP